MSKTGVLYIAHEINDYTLFNYNHIKNGLLENYELVWCLGSNTTKYKDYPNIKFHRFKYNKLSKFDNQYPNIFEIILNGLNRGFNKYDNIWVIEYDVLLFGKYSDLFNKYKDDNSDFLASNFIDINEWCHHCYFENQNVYKLVSFNTIFRISKKCIKKIKNQKYINIKDSFYETYIISICKNENLIFNEFDNKNTLNNLYKNEHDYIDYYNYIIFELTNNSNEYLNNIIHPIKNIEDDNDFKKIKFIIEML